MKANVFIAVFIFLSNVLFAQGRTVVNFNKDWKFFLGNDSMASNENYNDITWRILTLPHDWSIELPFDEKAAATTQGGALPGGIGWYRKNFTLPLSSKNNNVLIEFDGVYRNSEVWINGHYLGKRPNGYISFQYDLTPYIKFGLEKNTIAVKVDNAQQPNSRWYTGSGIYRNVQLVTTKKIAFEKWGTFIQTPVVKNDMAVFSAATNLLNAKMNNTAIKVYCELYDPSGKLVSKTSSLPQKNKNVSDSTYLFQATINQPKLWSVDEPNLYKAVFKVYQAAIEIDEVEIIFGIRSCGFDREKGFYLNNKPLKIKGVCMHHDLGALGAAFNIAAAKRQLAILKAMGCNAIRTAHNPPAPQFLDLCDQLGFLVMDEAFDMWQKKKNKFDYFSDFKEWHKQDLEDMVLRDRNHPSVFMWSIGNEIREQFDSTGIAITKALVNIVKQFDDTRPITAALTETDTAKNFIYQSNALDVIGWNYNEQKYPDVLNNYPGKIFIASETTSALATRGHYDMPSDSIRVWPAKGEKEIKNGNPDFTVSAYDNVKAYWGSTHEDTWKIIKKYDFLSGLFVWTGFDYLGEPTPYPWPARSSYFGIVDLAGFPKDVYYMYQSEWTSKIVLHLFPHWNWHKGQLVDVWAYYNNADEVELFLNGQSLGLQKKQGDDLHVMWRVNYQPGTLKAISRKNGKQVATTEIKTAGKPAKIRLLADKSSIKANGEDIGFVTVQILDADGNLVPDADNLIEFNLKGNAFIAGVDNGSPISMESFKANQRKAFNGLCLAMVQSKTKAGNIVLMATSKGLSSSSIKIVSK